MELRNRIASFEKNRQGFFNLFLLKTLHKSARKFLVKSTFQIDFFKLQISNSVKRFNGKPIEC